MDRPTLAILFFAAALLIVIFVGAQITNTVPENDNQISGEPADRSIEKSDRVFVPPTSPTVPLGEEDKEESVNISGEQAPTENERLAEPAGTTAPRRGEVLIAGEMYQIRWAPSETGENTRIKIYPSPVAICGDDKSCTASVSSLVSNFLLADGIADSGLFNWLVGRKISPPGEELPPGKYNIVIESVSGEKFAESEIFAITKAQEAPEIETAVPYNPAEMPYPADPLTYSSRFDIPQAVMWRSSPSIFYVDIWIESEGCAAKPCSPGEGVYLIAQSVFNSGIFGWQPSAGDVSGNPIPPGKYELYIQDAEGKIVKSEPQPLILE